MTELHQIIRELQTRSAAILELQTRLARIEERFGPLHSPENRYGINPEGTYTVAELANITGGSRVAIYRALNRGRLRSIPSIGAAEIRGSVFLEWLATKRPDGSVKPVA